MTLSQTRVYMYMYCNISLLGFWSKIGSTHGEESAADVHSASLSQRAFQEKHLICPEGNVPTPVIHSLSTDQCRRVQKPNKINKSSFKQAYDLHYRQPADDSKRKGRVAETFPETPQSRIFTAIPKWAVVNNTTVVTYNSLLTTDQLWLTRTSKCCGVSQKVLGPEPWCGHRQWSQPCHK